MRRALACLILAAGMGLPAVLLSCTSIDPALSPDCEKRPEAGVVMGVGEYTWVRLASNQGPFIQTTLDVGPGQQPGDFVWLGIGTTGLGDLQGSDPPLVTVSYGIRDDATGESLTGTNAGKRWPISYQGGDPPDIVLAQVLNVYVPGNQALFKLPAAGFTIPEQLVGDHVTVWADVNDACHPDPANPVHGEYKTTLSGYDMSTCAGCLDQQCHAELASCDSDCHAIQGCLDTYCVNLSALESSDEALCQAYCQGLYSTTSRDAHVALVTCVQDMARGALCATQTCLDNPVDGGTPPQFCYVSPPCHPYPVDYKHCLNQVNDAQNGQCHALQQSCNKDPSGQCASYMACNASCGSWPACQACAAQYPFGEARYSAYQTCIESACLAQGWVIHIF